MSLHGAHLRHLRDELALLADDCRGDAPDGALSLAARALLMAPPAARGPKHGRPTGVEAPSFSVEGGVFAEQAVVGITGTPGYKLRYFVEKVPTRDTAPVKGGHSTLFSDGLQYRRPIVLDELGIYWVHAVNMREEEQMAVSSIVSERYEVCPTEVQDLSGKHIADLPKQMIRGLVKFSGTTVKSVAPRLESMRRAIARMAKTVEGHVSIKLERKKDAKKGDLGVSVTFAVQVGRDDDGEEMLQGITDPSLVNAFAEVTGVAIAKIGLEATVKALDAVLLYLEWVFPESGRDFLDGSCMVYGEDRLLDIVDYRGAQSVNHCGSSSASTEAWSAGRGDTGSVVHSGDVMHRNGGRHAIIVRLSQLPAHATDCFFALSAYNCRNLSKFKTPRVRCFDLEAKDHLLFSYNLEQAGCASAAVICSLTRERGGGPGWSVTAYGQTCDGTVRDYLPIEAAIKPVQARYANWRRRAPIVRLNWLWNANRAFPRGVADRTSVLLPLMDLEPELFMNVVSFL